MVWKPRLVPLGTRYTPNKAGPGPATAQDTNQRREEKSHLSMGLEKPVLWQRLPMAQRASPLPTPGLQWQQGGTATLSPQGLGNVEAETWAYCWVPTPSSKAVPTECNLTEFWWLESQNHRISELKRATEMIKCNSWTTRSSAMLRLILAQPFAYCRLPFPNTL